MPDHGFKRGDRVEVVDRRSDLGLHSTHATVLYPERRGTVTYARKMRRVGVDLDGGGATAQILTRHLRKLSELEVLAEG